MHAAERELPNPGARLEVTAVSVQLCRQLEGTAVLTLRQSVFRRLLHDRRRLCSAASLTGCR